MTRTFVNALKAVRPGNAQSCLIPSEYDLSLEDVTSLVEMAKSGATDAVFDAINRSFMFGFVMGNRCTHRRKFKRL